MSDLGDKNELTSFVAQTLKGIADGISSSGISQQNGPMGSDAFRMPQQVEFDIAVTAKHTSEAGGGFKIQVFGAGVDVGGKGADEAQTVSRVQFTVPWQYEGVLQRAIGPGTKGPLDTSKIGTDV